MIAPTLVMASQRDAPKITLEFVPSARRGNAWRLETGELDLALGAVVDQAPGIRRADLCTEGFSCAVRRGYFDIEGSLSLDQFVRTPHAMITLGDDTRPTWIDESLAKKHRTRRVALRVRHFMAAPLIVASTDLLMTGPSMLIRYFAKRVPLQVLAPPIALPNVSGRSVLASTLRYRSRARLVARCRVRGDAVARHRRRTRAAHVERNARKTGSIEASLKSAKLPLSTRQHRAFSHAVRIVVRGDS